MSSRFVCLFWCASLCACSSEDASPNVEQAGLPNSASGQGAAANGAQPGSIAGVRGQGRPAGMLIGQGASGNTDETRNPVLEGNGGTSSPNDGESDIEIPIFDSPDDVPPPCSGCVELNVDVNDINQRDDFVFSAGGVNVTRVVWTLIIPFNSDQLFVQPFVDSSYGTFTDLDANAFTIDTPVQVAHQFRGTANNVGIAIGSSGAWTGNMTMSVFVDSVTLELEDAPATASRTFDADAQGLASRSAAHNPKVVFHP
jgi:hypothetical protein